LKLGVQAAVALVCAAAVLAYQEIQQDMLKRQLQFFQTVTYADVQEWPVTRTAYVLTAVVFQVIYAGAMLEIYAVTVPVVCAVKVAKVEMQFVQQVLAAIAALLLLDFAIH
jgi:hypothetical protein